MNVQANLTTQKTNNDKEETKQNATKLIFTNQTFSEQDRPRKNQARRERNSQAIISKILEDEPELQ